MDTAPVRDVVSEPGRDRGPAGSAQRAEAGKHFSYDIRSFGLMFVSIPD